MMKLQVLAWTTVAALNNFSVAQQITFRTWFEAPEEVLAGETFQVKLWASIERDGVLLPAGPSQGYFSGIVSSIESSGSGAEAMAFSTLLSFPEGLLILPSASGTPDGNWLRDFVAFQQGSFPIPPIVYLNPHPLVMFEVTVALSASGNLFLDMRDSFRGLAVEWVDSASGRFILSNDPGVLFAPETGVIRVIPAPASLALLASLALASTRRRRA